MEIIQGKTTVSEASRQFDLDPSEIEEWIEQGKAGMVNAPRAKPEDVREQYEREIKTLQEAYGEAMLELRTRKNTVPAGQGRAMIEGLRQGLKDDCVTVSISKLCQWFSVPRRTIYYKPSKSPPRLDPAFVEPIKAMIEEEPSFGYRTVANLLGFNKNTGPEDLPAQGLAALEERQGKHRRRGAGAGAYLQVWISGDGRQSVSTALDNGLVFTSWRPPKMGFWVFCDQP